MNSYSEVANSRKFLIELYFNMQLETVQVANPISAAVTDITRDRLRDYLSLVSGKEIRRVQSLFESLAISVYRNHTSAAEAKDKIQMLLFD